MLIGKIVCPQNSDVARGNTSLKILPIKIPNFYYSKYILENIRRKFYFCIIFQKLYQMYISMATFEMSIRHSGVIATTE